MAGEKKAEAEAALKSEDAALSNLGKLNQRAYLDAGPPTRRPSPDRRFASSYCAALRCAAPL